MQKIDEKLHYKTTVFQKLFLRMILFSTLFFLFTTHLFAIANSVAVLPFANETQDASLDWLSMGISETITNDLLAIKGLVLVERIQLSKVMDEQSLQLTGVVDEKTAVQLGKLIGAQILVVGAFQKQAQTIRLTARFVDVETGGVIQTAKATGEMDDIFDLQDQIVTDLAKNLNIELKREELARLSVKPTESLEAYQHFGQGALLQAKKDYQGAAKELQKAADIDPKFTLAKNKFVEIFLSLNKGNYWTFESDSKSKTKLVAGENNAHGTSTYRAGGEDLFNGTPAFSYIIESALESTQVGSLKMITYNYYVKKEDGIRVLGSKQEITMQDGKKMVTTSIFDPPYLLYPYDLEVGKQWVSNPKVKVTISGILSTNSVASQEEKTEVISRETITVPAGTFDCYVIKSESTLKGKNSGFFTGGRYSAKTVTTTWFAQGVGIIKSQTKMEVGKETTKASVESVLSNYHIEE